MGTWSLKKAFTHLAIAEPARSYTLVIGLSSCLALLVLVAIAAIAALAISRRRRLPELTAPEFYTGDIWAEPDAHELDVSFSDGPEISGDYSLSQSPFGTDSQGSVQRFLPIQPESLVSPN